MKKKIITVLLIVSICCIITGSIGIYLEYQELNQKIERYNAIINQFADTDAYIIENKERYVTYYEKNDKLSTYDIVALVNAGVDKTSINYTPLIMEIIKSELYQEQNLTRYVAYKNKYQEVKTENIIKLVNYGIDELDIDYFPQLVEIINDKYFIKNNLERYVKYALNNNKITREIVSIVNCNADRDFYTDIEETDVKQSYLMLVNKYYKLPNSYVPPALTKVSTTYGNERMDKTAYNYFIKMAKDAKKDGLTIKISDGYRTKSAQKGLYDSKLKNYGLEYAIVSSAKPRHSEHETGLALDLKVINNGYKNFDPKDKNRWLIDNCYKYGFILRYPKNKTYLTGYKYESWHYRYVGIDVSTYIHENDITYDEYYAYFILNKGQ